MFANPFYAAFGADLLPTLFQAHSIKYSKDRTLEKRDPALLTFVAKVIADRIEVQRRKEEHQKNIRDQIYRVSANNDLAMHFQPIWSVADSSVVGYEALARFNTHPYRTPDVWFEEAHQAGLGAYLESQAIAKALSYRDKIPNNCFLSINASPEAVLSGTVSRLFTRQNATRIILEVTEHSRILDYPEFRDAVQVIRKMGTRLAIDDAGSGYASLQHVIELDADIIKLDLNLIRNIHCDHKKQALAAALVSYAHRVKAQVVAEGVESQEEFNVLKDLKIDKVQGYLIGKPEPWPAVS